MNSSTMPRPIGFAPAEVSALVNRTVVSQHAEEAAFLWTQRNRAIGEPHYLLKDLAALDERVESHLEGLRIAGDAGWDYCESQLAAEGAGEFFAASILAFGAGHRDRMRQVLFTGCQTLEGRVGIVSALGWLDYPHVSTWIDALVTAKSSSHRAVGMAACAAHRRDPGAPVAAGIRDEDSTLRAECLRAVGMLKRRDLLTAVRPRLQDPDEYCQGWAAWALVLNGDRAGLPILADWMQKDDSFSRPAMQLALRAMPVEDSRKWVRAWAQHSDAEILAVVGAGIVGDPTSVEWLIRKMDSPELKRLAGEAFSMITGVDLAYHDLVEDPPPAPAETTEDEEALEDLALTYESRLPWPSARLVGGWWAKHYERFSPGVRHLGGTPIDYKSMRRVLSEGPQRQRTAAALELALLEPDLPLFETRERGGRQQRKLAAWTS